MDIDEVALAVLHLSKALLKYAPELDTIKRMQRSDVCVHLCF
jgi:hypothetical protein